MIIDVHGHLGEYPAFHFPDTSVQRMLSTMDNLGISKIVCSHMDWLLGNPSRGITESIQAYNDSDHRILSYAVFNPSQPGSLDQVRDSMQNKAFAGIKIHPSFHKTSADDPKYEPIWRYAHECKCIILTHSWDISQTNPSQELSFPARFEKWVVEYPDTTLILGHAGGRYGGHLAAVDLCSKYKNIFVDISGDSFDTGLIEFLVENAGPDRVLFGTDMNWIDPRAHLGRVYNAAIPLKTMEQVLWGNALSIFGNCL
jgi:predicted TIM-barrel fold metal-dependent hydrolase